MSFKEIDPLKTYNNKFFSPDYIKNNPILIYITSPEGKFEPLNIYNLVRGSIKLTQTLCSESYFLWGGFNAGKLEFECCSSALIDSAPDGLIQLTLTPTVYENGRFVEKLVSESVTLFTGYIETATPTSIPGNWKVVAYDRLYRMRNVDISAWINAYIKDVIAAGNTVSWYDILSLVTLQLGIHTGGVVKYPVSEYLLKTWRFPTNRDITGKNGIDLLRDFAFLMQSFGILDGNGKLQYVTVEDSNTCENYFCCNTWASKNLSYKAGHIWLPRLFTSEPKTNIFYTTAETTPDEDYYNNIYCIKNSNVLGDQEWINSLYECDEYGTPSMSYSAENLPVGLFDTRRLCLINGETFSQQEYMLRAYMDPTIPMGSVIYINKFDKEAGWTNIVQSYIMERTITITCSQLIECTISAKNGPYNSEVKEYEYGLANANALANKANVNLPFIVDDGVLTKLRAHKVLTQAEYDALEEKRSDTIYYVYDDGGDS